MIYVYDNLVIQVPIHLHGRFSEFYWKLLSLGEKFVPSLKERQINLIDHWISFWTIDKSYQSYALFTLRPIESM